VPAVVGLAMSVIIGIGLFNPFHVEINTPNLSGNMVVSGSKVTMETPHLTGYTATDQRPYDLVAKTATQDLTDPDHVTLNTLRAKVLMEDQSTVTLDARTGVFDTKQQLLDLRKDIVMTTSTGYQARLSQAFVDMGKGTVTSDEHVDVKLTNGTLTADRLRITDGGDVVRFEGNVVMHLDNLGDNAAASTADASAEPIPPRRTRAAAKSANAK
jgi:lipopolysaccharide export system protein LptC